jgi:hypothetical protein
LPAAVLVLFRQRGLVRYGQVWWWGEKSAARVLMTLMEE